MIRKQLSKQEATKLFTYMEGELYWRVPGSGSRPDGCASHRRRRGDGRVRSVVRIGGSQYLTQYLVWNFHHGIAPGKVVQRVKGSTRIEDLFVVDLTNFIAAQVLPKSLHVKCPCCDQTVASPSPSIIAETLGLTPMEEKIFETVHEGKGRRVSTETIFDAMYADDEDGGPSSTRMYSTLKETLFHLRRKLVGTGINIETIGGRYGYRLVMKGDLDYVEPRNSSDERDNNGSVEIGRAPV